MTPRMTTTTRNTAAVVLVALVAGAIGFGAAAELRGFGSTAFVNNLGTILLPAIPALAAFIRGGRIQKELAQVKEQTNGTTSAVVDLAARSVDALAAVAGDPSSARRAAQLIRTIEAAAGPTSSTPPAQDPPTTDVGSPPTP